MNMAYGDNQTVNAKVRDLLKEAKELTDSIYLDDTGESRRSLSSQIVESIDVYDGNDFVDSSGNHCDGRIASSAVCAADSAMSVELKRLATYKNWPHSAPINPRVLARAGFFYTGIDDMVECFTCNGKIKDWEHGDSAMGEHKRHFQRCKFVLEQDKLNQSLVKGRVSVSVAKDKRKSIVDDLYKPNQAASIDIAKVPKKLKSEYRRLLSFQKWPRANPMEPRDLAKAGFFYTQTEDVVQCFACAGKISNWKTVDAPMSQHRTMFSECPFVRGENVGNEKLTTGETMNAQLAVEDNESSVKLPPSMLNSARGTSITPIQQTAKVTDQWSFVPKSLSRQLTRTQHSHYSRESERIKTFEYWQRTAPPFKPLAEAGFFFTGENDNVKCFYCNGGLRNWETNDDPWTEHAKWFPKCEWLIQQRGKPFIQYVNRNFPMQTQNEYFAPAASNQDLDMLHGTARPSANLSAKTQSPPDMQRVTIEHALKSTMVGTALEMGYSRRKITRIIERRLNKNEGEFSSVEMFLNAVFEEPDEQGDDDEACVANGTDFQPRYELTDEEKQAATKANLIESTKLEERMTNLTVHDRDLQTKQSTVPPLCDEEALLPPSTEEALLPPSIQNELRNLRETRKCKICMDDDINVLFMPCGHLVSCETCAESIKLCPMCRSPIANSIKTFMA